MKKSYILSILCLVLFSISCSMLETTIQIKSSFSYTLTRSATDSKTINEAATKDMTDADVEKNKDKLKEVAVSHAAFTVSDFTVGNPVLNGELKFTSPSAATPLVLGTLTNVNLKALAASGEETKLSSPNATALQTLSEAIKNGETVNFTIVGSTSEVPMSAKVNFVIYSDLTVGI